MDAIQFVIVGKLPVNLINPTTLHNILKNISLHVLENYELVAGARIGNIHLYYDFITVAAIGDAHHIKIMLNVPLKTENRHFDTPTDNLEIRNVHIACLQPPQGITQRFSKLKRLIRVIGYCKRFISNCRNPKANMKSTILSTQDLDQALTCCVKMVQQISYVQEMRNLIEQQEVAASSSLKTLHPFIDKEVLLRVRGRLQQSTCPYQTMQQMILLQIITSQNWLSQQST